MSVGAFGGVDGWPEGVDERHNVAWGRRWSGVRRLRRLAGRQRLCHAADAAVGRWDTATGNDANHDIELMTMEAADDLLGLVDMLLRVVYEYPARG